MSPQELSELNLRLVAEEGALKQFEQDVQRAEQDVQRAEQECRASLTPIAQEHLGRAAKQRAVATAARDAQLAPIKKLKAQIDAGEKAAKARAEKAKPTLAAYVSGPAKFLDSIAPELAELKKLAAAHADVHARIGEKCKAFDETRAAQRAVIKASGLGLVRECDLYGSAVAASPPNAIDFVASVIEPTPFAFGLPMAALERGFAHTSVCATKFLGWFETKRKELEILRNSIVRDDKPAAVA
jgi:hypothetical protein